MSEHCRFSEHEQKPFSSDSRASIFKVTGYCSENQKHSGKWQMFTYTWELKFCLVSFAWEQSWPDSDQTKTWERKCVYWSNKQGHLEKCVHNSILVFVLGIKTCSISLVCYNETIESLVCNPSWILYCPKAVLCLQVRGRVWWGAASHRRRSGEEIVCYIKLIGSVFSDHDPSQSCEGETGVL